MSGGEQWKFDARMGGGSLSLLAAYVTDIISHILQEQATRAQGQQKNIFFHNFLVKYLLFLAFSARSPLLSSCDSFTAFHLAFPSGASASATVALADYFEVKHGFLEFSATMWPNTQFCLIRYLPLHHLV